MAPKFGTSGLRGLASELTPGLVAAHVRGFLAACPTGGAVWLGRDLRESSPRLADHVTGALLAGGVDVVDAGVLPTPALALAALEAGQAAIMVTGSHIPANRNGLKFYRPDGEIDKADEAAILAGIDSVSGGNRPSGSLRQAPDTARLWTDRARAWGPGALHGLRLGLWQHSSVARDLLPGALEALGAEVVLLDRAESFVPVDTEAMEAETLARLAGWVAEHRLDALVSTDGDGDRPLVIDETGQMVPGDVLGPLSAKALEAGTVVTPVSSNGVVERMGFSVIRTRIGSPPVIAGMAGRPRALGYEPNGGLLLGYDAQGPVGPLPALATRDSLVPILAPLAMAKAAGQSLSALVAALPLAHVARDRIAGISPARAEALMARLTTDKTAREALTGAPEAALDLTDGLRMTDDRGRILHIRPSRNAPEFRVYCEANDPKTAHESVAATIAALTPELKD